MLKGGALANWRVPVRSMPYRPTMLSLPRALRREGARGGGGGGQPWRRVCAGADLFSFLPGTHPCQCGQSGGRVVNCAGLWQGVWPRALATKCAPLHTPLLFWVSGTLIGSGPAGAPRGCGSAIFAPPMASSARGRGAHAPSWRPGLRAPVAPSTAAQCWAGALLLLPPRVDVTWSLQRRGGASGETGRWEWGAGEACAFANEVEIPPQHRLPPRPATLLGAPTGTRTWASAGLGASGRHLFHARTHTHHTSRWTPRSPSPWAGSVTACTRTSAAIGRVSFVGCFVPLVKARRGVTRPRPSGDGCTGLWSWLSGAVGERGVQLLGAT